MSPARRIGAALLVTGWIVAGPITGGSAQAADVLLGSPTYAQGASGFGTAHPGSFFNGGVPSGLVDHITWRHWGEATATGTGRGHLYKPQGGYFAKAAKVKLRVSGIGHCPGQAAAAYTLLYIRSPSWPGGPLGSWRKWSGSKTICDYNDTDPAYEYPKRPPGDCGQIGGDDYSPGDLFDIQAYGVGCERARRVAIRSRRSHRKCLSFKCLTRRSGFRCRWQAVHSDETAPAINTPYPVQRVSCRHGHSTLSWWNILAPV
jgi:hypothetical protein